MTKTASQTRQTVYEQITAKIVVSLDSSIEGQTWTRPWATFGKSIPTNAITNKPYRGINTLVLMMTAHEMGYNSNTFATFNQWKSLSTKENPVSVRKGEKATMIVFFKPIDSSDDNEGEVEERKGLIARAYYVFAREQVDGLPEFQAPAGLTNEDRIEQAETYFANCRAITRFEGQRAYYLPLTDVVTVPPKSLFSSLDHFYSTMGHEMGHWTGAESRLNRAIKNKFGSEAYAFEELVAELTSTFLDARLQLTTDNVLREDHIAYLRNWSAIIKSTPRAIFQAASLAQQAVDHMDGMQTTAAQALAA